MTDDWQKHIKTTNETSLQRLALIVYVLQATSVISGSLTLFAGVIINYVRREDVKGTWIESHFRWQTKTFWHTLLWMIIGGVTTLFLIGWVILLGTSIWLVYRIAKGFVYLNEKKEMPC